MKVEILHGNSGAVLYSCDAPDGLSRPTALGRAVVQALAAGISLTSANLASANLAWANLAWANLASANLAWANLASANLAWANLAWANLAGANLSQANFANAVLGDNRILDGGLRSDGWRFFLWWDASRGWRIRAGCRDFSIEEARSHWSIDRQRGTLDAESMAIINHLRNLAEARGWDLSETVE